MERCWCFAWRSGCVVFVFHLVHDLPAFIHFLLFIVLHSFPTVLFPTVYCSVTTCSLLSPSPPTHVTPHVPPHISSPMSPHPIIPSHRWLLQPKSPPLQNTATHNATTWLKQVQSHVLHACCAVTVEHATRRHWQRCWYCWTGPRGPLMRWGPLASGAFVRCCHSRWC